MRKDSGKQPAKEICREVWEGLRAGASVPLELGVCLSPAVNVLPSLEALWTLYFWEFLEASSHRRDQSLTPFSTLLPSHENGGGAENSKTDYGLVLAVLLWEPSGNPLRVTSVEEKTITPGGSVRKNLPAMWETWVWKIPWRRKWQPTPGFLPGESMDRGAWWATVYGVVKSRAWLMRLNISSSRVEDKLLDKLKELSC